MTANEYAEAVAKEIARQTGVPHDEALAIVGDVDDFIAEDMSPEDAAGEIIYAASH